MSMIALICSEYFCRVLYHSAYTADPRESVQGIPEAVIKAVAIAFIGVVSLLNILSDRVGTRTQVVLTSGKVGQSLSRLLC
jgi:hypothetical protein